MNNKTNLIQLFVVFLLFILPFGCVSKPAPMTPKTSATKTSALDGLSVHSTDSAETLQPKVVPKPTATQLPTRTLESTPTGEPRTSLSEEGPWLVYRHASDFTEGGPINEFVILNQDGSGRTLIKPDHDINTFLMRGENSVNYMIFAYGGLYLFRPSLGTAAIIQSWYPTFAAFTGNEDGGLLASIYQPTNDAIPELIIYELPGGKIRSRFSLVRCPAQAKGCESDGNNLFYDMRYQRLQWSPNGRYLAFVALQNTISSDLYVYDKDNGNLRQLTSGPDWVGQYRWSPDGSRIIFEEIIMPWNNQYKQEELFYLSGTMPTSMWSASVSNSEIKLLYTLDNNVESHILMWLDDKRFLAHGGDAFDIISAAASVGWNIRLVDTASGKTSLLFDSSFGSAVLDKAHEVLAIYAFDTEKYPQGIYLVSIKNSTIHYLEGPPYLMDFPEWDEKTGLFISGDDCQNDSHSFQAFDYLGNFKCVPQPTPTPKPEGRTRYPSPNGELLISLNNGVWLEKMGKEAVQVSTETAPSVIWCPDSSCFFFPVLQQNRQWSLYRVSLPDLTVEMVDKGIESMSTYQWLGGKAKK